ncbi:MAG: N-acyl homoserine lactonase family protein [Acidimicrobiales bacterium]
MTLSMLPMLPRVDRLTLAVVTAVPEWHPEHATFEPFPVHAWVIHHPDGIVLVDTGIGFGNQPIDDMYHPRVTSLVDALGSVRLQIADITAVVLSHLHFDHCGQQAVLDAPVYVQAAELEVAETPGYTVAEWAAIPRQRLRIVDGDEEILDGVRLLSTPGHTPGHQAVVIEAEGKRIVLAAQCAYRASELQTGEPGPTNLHAASWADTARRSLQRIRSLAPLTAQLSHDPAIVSLS